MEYCSIQSSSKCRKQNNTRNEKDRMDYNKDWKNINKTFNNKKGVSK